MHDFFVLMWKPFLACLVLAGIHAYLGIHVLERKVVFVDLALAQIAALGAAVGVLFHMDLHGPSVYWLSLCATIAGAGVLALTRSRKGKIPQEAVIGIVYAVSAAASVLLLSNSPEGDEHIRFMLVGNILLVSWPEIVKMTVLYSVIGLIHWIFRAQFNLISSDPESAYKKGLPVKFWDFIFYFTFGAVVTSSVQIAGVLLVFSLLIVPAVFAVRFSDKFSVRLMLGWLFSLASSIAGLIFSYVLDLPTGAAVICAFAGFLVISMMFAPKTGR